MNRHDWERMQAARCAAKRHYLSETCARNAAWLLMLKPGTPYLEPYRCCICGDYALTSHIRVGRSTLRMVG